MTFSVRLSPRARSDLQRLPRFLALKSEPAAAKARAILAAALRNLELFPMRGREVGAGVREVVVAFGRDAYLIRYVVLEQQVLVTRLLHSRERR